MPSSPSSSWCSGCGGVKLGRKSWGGGYSISRTQLTLGYFRLEKWKNSVPMSRVTMRSKVTAVRLPTRNGPIIFLHQNIFKLTVSDGRKDRTDRYFIRRIKCRVTKRYNQYGFVQFTQDNISKIKQFLDFF